MVRSGTTSSQSRKKKPSPEKKAQSPEGNNQAAIPGDSLPFTFATPPGFSQADVESIRTSFRAYDSLGIPMDIDVTMVMESKNASGGITWRYFAESSDDSDADRVVGTGTITFDSNGNYLEGLFLDIAIVVLTGLFVVSIGRIQVAEVLLDEQSLPMLRQS